MAHSCLAVFLSLSVSFWPFPTCKPKYSCWRSHSLLHTHTHIFLLLFVNLWMKRPLQSLLNSTEETHQTITSLFFFLNLNTCFFFFATGPRDETDNCVLFQIVFLTQAGRSMRTTEKAKSSWEQLFTPSLCSFVPPLPSAAFGSESALVLLAVTVCQGANRFLLTGASGGQVWVFHYFLYQVGIIWMRTGLSAPLCVGAGLCAWIECVSVFVKNARTVVLYLLVCARENEYVCIYEV